MVSREEQLSKLHSYIEGVDNEVTMLLQSLQWDRKSLLEGSVLVSCAYEPSHKVPPDRKEAHEATCLLRREGYHKDDKLLPEVLEPAASTVVKLSKQDIEQIINNVVLSDPSFKKGPGCLDSVPPLTAERLQATYSADERRVIHDAVASAAPDFDNVEDFALTSAEVAQERRRKSRLEVLAELRDMRRRRAKYRVSAPSDNYSHVLRDLIRTQMEIYTGVAADAQTARLGNNSGRVVNIKQEPLSDEDRAGAGAHSSVRDARDRHKDRAESRHGNNHGERNRTHDNYRERNSTRLSRYETDVKQEPNDYDRNSPRYEKRYEDKHSLHDSRHERRHGHKPDSRHSRSHKDKSREPSTHDRHRDDNNKLTEDNERGSELYHKKKKRKETEHPRDERSHRDDKDRHRSSRTHDKYYDDTRDDHYTNHKKRQRKDREHSYSRS